jgi:hypothetical protein
MAQCGFFSFVGEHANPSNPGAGVAKGGNIIIRARSREHLEAMLTQVQDRAGAPCASMADKVLGDAMQAAPIIAGGGTDYPFRVKVPKPTAALLMAMLTDDIDYDNFKGAVKDHAYHAALMQVWSCMRKLESGSVKKKHA